ncbi:MAG: tRNA (N6-isopentenyl adenosine(37)-C2)-methylthiotransferase MiaB [Bacteroidales bacterium]
MSKKLYIETYGCQMNFSDSEIVNSILVDHRFEVTSNPENADLIFVNTCSIRENAEKRVMRRLNELKRFKKSNPRLVIGVLGCMAERMKESLLAEAVFVDLIAGPDSYRDLPKLVDLAEGGQKAINVILSADETYADINPVRLDKNKVSAFISIMRGCENHCAYCVVPSVRGVERSRDPETILQECRMLFDQGYREVTLLGQNVNSYDWEDERGSLGFPQLLEKIALINKDLRVRFATSHPKDLSDELIATMVRNENICRSIHLPVQSGSSRILKLMNRKYDREWYMDRVNAIKKNLPDCGITTDIITGFCTETEEDHQETLSLMQWAEYDYAYMFKYSERPGTIAAKKLADDVPDEVKSRRLEEIINLQQELSLKSNQQDIGKTFSVLVEGTSKRSDKKFMGRNSRNKVIVFSGSNIKPGTYKNVTVTDCTAATLIGKLAE